MFSPRKFVIVAGLRAVAASVFLLCHFSMALAADNWQQVNNDGFFYPDDRSDDGTRLHRFNNQLYATNSDGVFLLNNPVTKSWAELTIPAPPAGPGGSASFIGVIGDYFYAKSSGNLWWIQTGSALNSTNWQQVAIWPVGEYSPFVEFNGSLYAEVVTLSGAFEIWRTPDVGSTGMTWTRVVQNSFGDPANNKSISTATVYDGELYIGTDTILGVIGNPGAYNDGVEVWSSSSGDLGDWSQVNTDGFGVLYPGCDNLGNCNFPIHQLIGSAGVFASLWDGSERLYIGTMSHFGGEVWSYNGSNWTNVTPPWGGPCLIGCGPGRNVDMQVFDNYLYMAEGYPTGNLSRFDGHEWYIEVDGEFPSYPFDPGNDRLVDLEVYNDRLFVTTKTSSVPLEEHGDQVWGFFPPDRYVATTGIDTGACTNPSQPCRTIQYGLDQCSNGETIRIAQGVYAEQVVIDSKLYSVTLEGGWGNGFATRLDDPMTTRLSASASGRALFLNANVLGRDMQLHLLGMTVSDGFVLANGGGILALADYGRVTLELDRVVVRDNSALGGGGVALDALNNGSVLFRMERSAAASNAAVSGGAIYTTTTGSGTRSRLNMTNSFVNDNFAFIDGGGLAGYAAALGQLEMLFGFDTFTGNDADNFGGGIYLWAQANGTINAGLTGGIAWGNQGGGDNHAEDIYLTESGPSGSTSLFGEYSNIGVLAGLTGLYDDRGGNTGTDPAFLGFGSGFYFLSGASPVIDVAACGVLVLPPPAVSECVRKAPYVDYSGHNRPASCVIQCDMGADEYVPFVVTDSWNCELQDVYVSSGLVSGAESCLAANLIEISGLQVSATGSLDLSVISDSVRSGYVALGTGFKILQGGRVDIGLHACTPHQTYVAGLGCLP